MTSAHSGTVPTTMEGIDDPMMAVDLPGGRRTTGRDRDALFERVFRDGAADRSVLDLGCNLGQALVIARRFGATRTVGVELDAARAAKAAAVARMWGQGTEIRQGAAQDFAVAERFDVVLLLDVLHHVPDASSLLRTAAALGRRELWVHFSAPWEPDHLMEALPGPPRVRSVTARALAALCSPLRHTPLAAIGRRPGHRTWYFTPRAFEHLMVDHLALAARVDTEPSPVQRHRFLARCTLGG